jgi:hypothetical protein
MNVDCIPKSSFKESSEDEDISNDSSCKFISNLLKVEFVPLMI